VSRESLLVFSVERIEQRRRKVFPRRSDNTA
jgi:hypothetical protein